MPREIGIKPMGLSAENIDEIAKGGINDKGSNLNEYRMLTLPTVRQKPMDEIKHLPPLQIEGLE